MPAATRETLKLTDEQNRRLDALQPEFESKLADILSEEQNKQLKEPLKSIGPGRHGTGRCRPGHSYSSSLYREDAENHA